MPNEEALACLPHGPEFRFVDEVIELEPGKRGIGTYLVRGDEPFLKGHFPGNPIMPGVLLVEAAAQLGGVVAQSDPERQPLRNLKLTAITGAKILGSVASGQKLVISVEVQGRLSGLVQIRAEISVEEIRVLSATLALSGEEPETR